MKNLIKNFLKGCAVIVPVAVTAYVIWWVCTSLYELLPGVLGVLVVILAVLSIAVIGAFAGNVIGRRIFNLMDRVLSKIPLVKFLYTTVRDILSALVGDNRSFEKPVVVSLSDEKGSPKMLGFVTCDNLAEYGLDDHVAVYFPQSLNFAGNLLMFPRRRVEPLQVDQAKFMAFVVSGGVVQPGA